MGGLYIRFSGTGYISYVENTDVIYKFKGATAGDQLESVERLQQCMENGFNNVVANASDIFSNVGEGTEEDVMTFLFNSTDELYFGAEMIFSAGEGETLLTEIVEAAAELAEVLSA